MIDIAEVCFIGSPFDLVHYYAPISPNYLRLVVERSSYGKPTAETVAHQKVIGGENPIGTLTGSGNTTPTRVQKLLKDNGAGNQD